MVESYFHTAAYNESQGIGATNDAIAIVPDGILTPAGTGFILPEPMSLGGIYAGGVGITRVRLDTPKFRNPGLPTFSPANLTRQPPTPYNVAWLYNQPLMLNRVDQVTFQSTNTDAGAQVHTVIAWFYKNFRPVPAEPSYKLRGTFTLTLTDGTWVGGAIVMEQALPNGNYLITDLEVICNDAICARLVIGGSQYRPGTICQAAVGNIRNNLQNEGAFGCYGMFDNINIPNIEVLGDAAGAETGEIYLSVIPRGPVA